MNGGKQPAEICRAAEKGDFGFWILIMGTEYFVPFDDYPVFKRASVQQIFNMESLSPSQLHRPDPDADIETDALENPEKYPLIWKESADRVSGA